MLDMLYLMTCAIEPLSLAQNTSLESLQLELETGLWKLFTHFGPDERGADSIMQILDTLNAPNLRDLHIDILCFLPDSFPEYVSDAPAKHILGKDINWTPLNRVLAREHFDTLQRVKVQLDLFIPPEIYLSAMQLEVLKIVTTEIERRMKRSLWFLRGVLDLEVRQVQYGLPA